MYKRQDYICPDGIEKNSDYLKLGGKFCRVLFLKDYASYIKDNMVTELTDFNRNLMSVSYTHLDVYKRQV